MSAKREEAHDLLVQLELAIEREQELWISESENPEMKAVHSALGALRNALSETLEEE